MTIYVDGLFFSIGGIGRYYESLLKELSKRQIEIITSVPIRQKYRFVKNLPRSPYVKPYFVNYERFSLRALILHTRLLRFLEEKIEVFFFPHVTTSLYLPQRSVVTLHDLRCVTSFWDRGKVKKFVMKNLSRKIVSRARKVVCVSKTVKDELVKLSPKLKDRIEVIYEFVDEKFSMPMRKPRQLVPKPYLLYVGERKKHKNLLNLIIAFKSLMNKIPHCLVIAGKKEGKRDELQRALEGSEIRNRVFEFVAPDDEIIADLYVNADLFVFPSLYEGFGLPPLEAIASGCPTVVSDIPVMREILGDAGIFFSPYVTSEIEHAIFSILSNKDYRNMVISRQRSRLELFDKDKIIDQYLGVFDDVRSKK